MKKKGFELFLCFVINLVFYFYACSRLEEVLGSRVICNTYHKIDLCFTIFVSSINYCLIFSRYEVPTKQT